MICSAGAGGRRCPKRLKPQGDHEDAPARVQHMAFAEKFMMSCMQQQELGFNTAVELESLVTCKFMSCRSDCPRDL